MPQRSALSWRRKLTYVNNSRNVQGLVESVKEIDKVLADPKATRQQFWYSEQNLLKDAKEKVDQLNDKVANLGLPLDIFPFVARRFGYPA